MRRELGGFRFGRPAAPVRERPPMPPPLPPTLPPPLPSVAPALPALLPAPPPETAGLQRALEIQTDRIVAARAIAKEIIDTRAEAAQAKQERDLVLATHKVHAAPSRLDQILSKAEAALDAAFTRLEKAAAGTAENARTVDGIAEKVEVSNRVLADKMGQLSNGGPPLEDSTGA